MKKRVHRNDRKNLPWDFKKGPGQLFFPLLVEMLTIWRGSFAIEKLYQSLPGLSVQPD